MKTTLVLLSIALLLDLTACFNATPPKAPQSHHSQVQYVHDKEDSIKSEQNSEEEQQDPYQILNDLKPERMPAHYNGWNPYQQPESMPHSKFLPFLGYPQPIFIPYPFLVSPDMLYSFNGQNDIEESMSRASNRRPSQSSYRNSPIYYVRLPPTPYMFIPGLGYTSQPGTFTPNFSPILPYSSYPTVPLSSIFNLPVNFLANGKPTGIYQIGSPNDLQGQLPTLNPHRPAPPSYRPSYLPQSPYMPPTDTKLTNLKRPYFFNGRPEEIYVLPNNFNPMQSMYQDSLSGYY